MKRTVITSIVTLIFFSVWQALGIYLPDWINLLFLPPLILVFTLQYFKPLETIYISLACGIIVDILGGFLVGTNMLLMLIVAFVLGVINIFSGRVYMSELVYYVIPVSFVYRIMLLFGQIIFSGSQTNIYVLQLLLGPLIDSLISMVFFYFLARILVIVKSFDQTEFFKNRIGLHK